MEGLQEGLLIWTVIAVAMLLAYSARPAKKPARLLVALAILIYVAGGLLIAAAVVGGLIATFSGAGPLAIVVALSGVPVVWWITAGLAIRCGVPPRALFRRANGDPES